MAPPRPLRPQANCPAGSQRRVHCCRPPAELIPWTRAPPRGRGQAALLPPVPWIPVASPRRRSAGELAATPATHAVVSLPRASSTRGRAAVGHVAVLPGAVAAAAGPAELTSPAGARRRKAQPWQPGPATCSQRCTGRPPTFSRFLPPKSTAPRLLFPPSLDTGSLPPCPAAKLPWRTALGTKGSLPCPPQCKGASGPPTPPHQKPG